MSSNLATHLERHLRDHAEEITGRWVDQLTRLRGEHERDALPGHEVLNHIPAVLRGLAEFLGDGGRTHPLTPMIRADLGRLADLRRRQGSSLEQILDEFSLLSALVEEAIEEAITSYGGDVDRAEVVRLVGRAKDAIFVLGSETASRFRAWAARRRHERLLLLERYTDMLSHELGNRLGAAETAVRLLMGQPDLTEERRNRLNQLILKSVRSGLETVRGVAALLRARDDPEDQGPRLIPLDKVMSDAVHQLRVRAAERGIALELIGTVPAVSVDLERFPLVFFNLAGNAIRHHDCPEGRGRVAIRVVEGPTTVTVEIADDGPGLPDRIHDEHLGANGREEGHGLGLAIAREAVEQMEGTLEHEPNHPRGSVLRFSMPVPESPA